MTKHSSMTRWTDTKEGLKLTDPTARELKMLYFHRGHDFCALCHIPQGATNMHRYPLGLQMAHLVGGAMRVNQPWNILMLCDACHRAQHDGNVMVSGRRWPNVIQANLFWAKNKLGELEVNLLAALWGRTPEHIRDLAKIAPAEGILRERRMWPTPRYLRRLNDDNR